MNYLSDRFQLDKSEMCVWNWSQPDRPTEMIHHSYKQSACDHKRVALTRGNQLDKQISGRCQ